VVPGKGIEPTLLSKLDFEKDALEIFLLSQQVASGNGGFASSLKMAAPWLLFAATVSGPARLSLPL
jgi:hypothetical protein